MIYKGRVEDISDPQNNQRVRIRVIGIHTFDESKLPSELLPWGTPILPITSGKISNGYGDFITPDIGDWVSLYYEFDDKLKTNPIYFGVFRTEQDINNNYDQNKNIYKKDKFNNSILIDSDNIKINLKNQNTLIEINKNNITINSNDANINIYSDAMINIGTNPSSPIVNWNGLNQYLSALESYLTSHMHDQSTSNISDPTTVSSNNNILKGILDITKNTIPTKNILIDE